MYGAYLLCACGIGVSGCGYGSLYPGMGWRETCTYTGKLE